MAGAGPAMAPSRGLVGSRSRRNVAVLLRVLPAVLFVFLAIAIPIGLFLFRAIDNSEVHDNLPGTIAALSDWQGLDPLKERHYEALANDLRALGDGPRLYQVARQLNYHMAGYRSAVLKASEAVRKNGTGAARTLIEGADPAWRDHAIWRVIAREAGALTPFFVLAALDLEIDEYGVRNADPGRALYREVFSRTVWMSLLIAAACVILGYPLAYFLANSQSRLAALTIYAVLLPFWNLPPRPHLGLDRHLPKGRCCSHHWKAHGLWLNKPALQPISGHNWHDPCDAAVHDSFDLCGDARHTELLHESRHLTWRITNARVPQCLSATIHAWDRRRCHDRDHTVARILSHPSAPRFAERSAYQLLHRLFHQ
jgi:ABC-type sugar transport system permease subunit